MNTQKPTEKNYLFQPNIWVSGTFNNNEIIGRTCIVNNKKMIICINENSSPLLINFSDIRQLGKLNFIDNKKEKPLLNPINSIPIKQLLTFITNNKN